MIVRALLILEIFIWIMAINIQMAGAEEPKRSTLVITRQMTFAIAAETPASRIDTGKGITVTGTTSSTLPVMMVLPMVPSKFEHNVNLPRSYEFFNRFDFKGLPNNQTLIINNQP